MTNGETDCQLLSCPNGGLSFLKFTHSQWKTSKPCDIYISSLIMGSFYHRKKENSPSWQENPPHQHDHPVCNPYHCCHPQYPENVEHYEQKTKSCSYLFVDQNYFRVIVNLQLLITVRSLVE